MERVEQALRLGEIARGREQDPAASAQPRTEAVHEVELALEVAGQPEQDCARRRGGLEDPVAISYGDIPGFAVSSVSGHAGRLVAGRCGGRPVLAMQGRVHLYEGHDLSTVVLPVRTMIATGCKILLVTNAAGRTLPTMIQRANHDFLPRSDSGHTFADRLNKT